jgi:hypothetical protein
MPLLLLSCWLVALSTANAIVGFGDIGGHECAELGGLLLWTALASAFTIPALHVLAHAVKEERRRQAARTAVAVAAGADPDTVASSGSTRSLSSTVRWALLGLLLVSTPSALAGISWLAEGRCTRRRSVRQLALVDIILVLSVGVMLLIYFALGKLPPRYARQLSRSGGKTIALVLCLSALIANIAQVKTHDAAWTESYHWSFTVRDPPCTHSCLAEQQSTAKRSIVCRDSAGTIVETPHCTGSSRAFRYAYPTAQVSLLKECPPLRMNKCKSEFAQVFANATQVEAGALLLAQDAFRNATASQPPHEQSKPAAGEEDSSSPNPSDGGLPAIVFPVGSVLDVPSVQARTDPDCPLQCANYPPDYQYPGSLDLLEIPLGCWQETEYLRQLAAGVPVPTGWVDVSRCDELELYGMNSVACPPRPCPAFCGPLESASIVYATVYSAAIAMLLVALFRKRIARTSLWRWLRTALCGAYDPAAAELEQTIRVPHAVLGLSPASRFTVDDEANDLPAGGGAHHQVSATGAPIGGSMASSASPSLAPTPSGHNDLPSVWHSLRMAVRALFLCSEGGLTCRELRPWWKHLLFFAGVLFLIGLLFYELSNMFWLNEAHCRDFLVSTLLNFLFTLLAALLLGALILRQRHRLVVQESNPFELAGLLDQQGQNSGGAADDGGDAETDGGELEDEDDEEALEAEFGLTSPAQHDTAAAVATTPPPHDVEAQVRTSLEQEPATHL